MLLGEIKPHIAPVPTVQNNATLKRGRKEVVSTEVQSKARYQRMHIYVLKLYIYVRYISLITLYSLNFDVILNTGKLK
jgi:hypothetical protein